MPIARPPSPGRSLAATMTVVGATALAACGARGPLDVEVIDVYPDAGSTLDGSIDAADASSDAASPSDAASDAIEGDASEGGNPVVDCVSCVGQMCGTGLVQCLTNTDCRADVQCIVQMCLTGGSGIDFGCIGTCTSSDPTAGGEAISAFTCILSGCGSQCTSLLGGLGGLGGGGGSGSGSSDGG